MSNRKIVQATQRLLHQIHQFVNTLTRGLVLWLLRGLLLLDRRTHPAQGFVLPTTILLLLLLTLTVGSITLRTYNRTNQAVGERQQQVIYNAGSPAIDRAKAKLEYLFNRDRDPRFPSGVPGQATLVGMMINDGQPHEGVIQSPHRITNDAGRLADPYTFPDEEETATDFLGLGADLDVDGNGDADRLDLDGDGSPDNAWAFRTDLNGDDIMDATVAYSIIFTRPLAEEADDPDPMESASDTAIQGRADRLEIRHGPLSLNNSENPACSFGGADSGVGPERGWFVDPANTSTLRKNFQIDVFVLPDNIDGTVSTLELHQDRQMEQGNKWGAWFRNDLEIFPGPRFNWNGAMHTEGNLIIGNDQFRGFLISSPASCLYSRAASEVTIANILPDSDEGIPAFQGQFISGKTNDESFGGTNYFHIYGTPPTSGENDDTRFNNSTDSVPNSGKTVTDYTLDPVILMTQDISKARGINDPETPEDYRQASWASRELNTQGRLFNRSEEAPYVDDSFRADNRYGPKARVLSKRIPENIGMPITNEQLNSGSEPILDEQLTRLEPPEGDLEGTEVGLDGYWDRRARNQGMRILVGERLELGNAHGFGNGIDGSNGQYRKEVPDEPLMPWDRCDANPNNNGRCHEARQRRSLYDNLAAVQASVFYHASTTGISTDADRDFPTACMASVVHPGSGDSLILSSAFKDLRQDIAPFLQASTIYQATSSHPVVSNFFMGSGTNGWEYEAVPENVSNETTFATAIADTAPLGRALRNLAYFAGDPLGGTPSFEPVDNATSTAVHPYPLMAMWGDFSVLRRVLAQLDGFPYNQGNPLGNPASPAATVTRATYAELSPADKATLHAASCMLGMLAYNIGFLDAFDYTQGPSADLVALEGYLTRLMNNQPSGVRRVGPSEVPEAFIAGLKQWKSKNSSLSAADQLVNPERMIALAETIMLKEQVSRDRRHGFTEGYSANYENLPNGIAFNLGGVGSGNLRKLTTDWPKFPALHYIFPGDFHDGVSAIPDGTIDPADDYFDEEEIDNGPYRYAEARDRYIERDLNSINGSPVRYLAIDLADENVLKDVAVYPKPMTSWVLPHVDAGTGNTNLSNAASGILIGCLDTLCGASPGSAALRLVQVGFKDTALFNGRELLPSRVMDVNIDLIRRSGTGLTGDQWLPNTGIIYAFREDAIREDEINRPTAIGGSADTAWDTCGRDEVFSDPSIEPNCYMQAGSLDAYSSTDPPLNKDNRISPKPVDYYPDPDRRPYGFRIRNGMRVDRATDTEGRGLSFVTDNPVYIMGNFNLHQSPTCTGAESCRLEEFTQKLNDDFNNFYSRSTLNSAFARPATDLWRPSEILADAISVLSDRFCDGSVEDIVSTVASGSGARVDSTLSTSVYGCSGNDRRTSFLNMDRLRDAISSSNLVTGQSSAWKRANPYDSMFSGDTITNRIRNNTPVTPTVFSRNGNPWMANEQEYNRRYYVLTDAKPLISTATNRVNSIIISGLVPSRKNQAYGGLHNFPRFIENWNTLYISGSLLQLSFSKYATAPFSQNSWESGVAPSGGESIDYYDPPERRWGYDVGLQYAPAGPLAERFVSIGSSPRSEFYSEPAADDPYMANLCRQIAPNPDQTCAGD